MSGLLDGTPGRSLRCSRSPVIADAPKAPGSRPRSALGLAMRYFISAATPPPPSHPGKRAAPSGCEWRHRPHHRSAGELSMRQVGQEGVAGSQSLAWSLWRSSIGAADPLSLAGRWSNRPPSKVRPRKRPGARSVFLPVNRGWTHGQVNPYRGFDHLSIRATWTNGQMSICPSQPVVPQQLTDSHMDNGQTKNGPRSICPCAHAVLARSRASFMTIKGGCNWCPRA